MRHPLETKIALLRRRARRLTVAYALSVMLVSLLAAFAILGTIDYFLQFSDRGVRIIASLAAFAVVGAAYHRFVQPFAFKAWSNVDLARRVERTFPSLSGRLVSAVEFLHRSQDDSLAGSLLLRRALVDQVAKSAEPLDFCEAIDRRPAFRAMGLLLAGGFAAVVLTILNPALAGIAVARLANPLGNTAWPRVNHLQVRQPVHRMARGQDFQVEVFDLYDARLPTDARIHYRERSSKGDMLQSSEKMLFSNGALFARRENVQHPFAYRIEGGDDASMSWSDVSVVDPPMIASLSVRLIPPAYTGQPATPSDRRIRALVGTKVQMAGRTTVPLSSAVLCFEDGRKIRATLADDGCTLGLESFAIEKSGAYWFNLTDRHGTHGGDDDRWEIVAIPDQKPTVRIEQPASDLFATPSGVIAVQASVHDDIAIRDAAIVFCQGENGPESVVPLPAASKATSSPAVSGDYRRVVHRWNLEPLHLQPGMQLVFRIVANDVRGQSGASQSRRIAIVDANEWLVRVSDQATAIQSELNRALHIQQAALAKVESLRNQAMTAIQIEPGVIDQLRVVEQTQREIEFLLSDKRGILASLVALRTILQSNPVEARDIMRELEPLSQGLERLEPEHLSPIRRALADARKIAQIGLESPKAPADAGRSTANRLETVAKHQRVVAASLEQWAARLALAHRYRSVCRQLDQLLVNQQSLLEDATILGRRTLARTLADLSSQETADLTHMTARQFEIARSYDRLLEDMEKTRTDLQSREPQTAAMLGTARENAVRLDIASRMRAAADGLRQNQIGQAIAGQNQIIEGLRFLAGALANRLAPEPAQLQDALEPIRRRQQESLQHTQKIEMARNVSGERAHAFAAQELARSQQAICADTERLAGRFSKDQALGIVLGSAVRAMQQAASALDRRETGSPAQDAQQTALRHLGGLIAALQGLRAAAERNALDRDGKPETSTGEKNAALAAAEWSLVRFLQEEILRKTTTLESDSASRRLAQDYARECEFLAGEQSRLAGIVERRKQPADESEEGSFFEAIAQQMREVEGRLVRADAGAVTQNLQRRILQELDRNLLAASTAALSQHGGAAVKTPEDSRQPSPASTDAAASRRPGSGPTRPSDPMAPGSDNPQAIRDTMQRLWGQLPPHAREQMLQMPLEEFPPAYELEIADYFRRLLEQTPPR